MSKLTLTRTDQSADITLKTIALSFSDYAAPQALVLDSGPRPIAMPDEADSAALAAVQFERGTLVSPASPGLPPEPMKRVLQGKIDQATRSVIQGWVWNPETPEERIRVELVKDGTTLATAVASNRRSELVAHGIGDGQYGLSINLEDGLLLEDRHVLHLRCAETGAVVPGSPIAIGEPREPKINHHAVSRDAVRFQGHIDCIDTEWRLCGWAYDPSEGGSLNVELVEDGFVIANAQASEFRQDLLDAGLGQGKCAFFIQIPSNLFDGGFHNLSVFVVGGNHREPMGKPFGTVFPGRGRRRGWSEALVPAVKIFEQITEMRAETGSRPSKEFVHELAGVLRKIGLRFGHSTALGLLYAYALRRSIDKDGLMTRLTRVHSDLSEYDGIVAEVIFSKEAAVIHGPSNYLTLDPIDFLGTWLDKKFGLLELPK
jgi:hypothetical protein